MAIDNNYPIYPIIKIFLFAVNVERRWENEKFSYSV